MGVKMKIAGFQKTSLIDYPGKIVSIVFTQGCNLKCPYCHNSELIPLENTDNSYFPEEDIFDFLKMRKKLIDGVSITGGEPLLQPDLINFIKRLKNDGLLVKLDTNGTNPIMLENLLKGNLLNYIAMDVKAPFAKYELATGVGHLNEKINLSIELIKDTGNKQNLDYEFRTTVVPGIHKNEDILEIGKIIKGAKNFYLQNFRPVNTYDPELMKITGFPPAKLAQFKEIISPYVDKVKIRE
jgi:pyruvate formate lyase activating enzyme